MIIYLVKNICTNAIIEIFDSAEKAQKYIDEFDQFGEMSFWGKLVK